MRFVSIVAVVALVAIVALVPVVSLCKFVLNKGVCRGYLLFPH